MKTESHYQLASNVESYLNFCICRKESQHALRDWRDIVSRRHRYGRPTGVVVWQELASIMPFLFRTVSVFKRVLSLNFWTLCYDIILRTAESHRTRIVDLQSP